MSVELTVVLLHGVQSSASTWWRVGPDLIDLGFAVVAPDLPGHGGRPAERASTLADMAEDVVYQLDGTQVDLIVGHSLGGLVALTLAAAHPGLVHAILIEDPPALGPLLDPADVAENIDREVLRARSTPDDVKAELLRRNPLWSSADAHNDVANRRSIDVAAVTSFLRTNRWDLPALIRDCPVPVHLLLASGPESAVSEPARSEILAYLEPASVTEVDSGHSVHRDRPAVWTTTVLRVLSSANIPGARRVRG